MLGVQLSDTECAAVWVPAPETEMEAGELVALLATVTLPDRLPAVVGVNVSSSVADCPGVRTSPAETPLAV